MNFRVAGAGVAAALALITIVVVAVSPWSGGSAADVALQGDADCSESIDSLDALADLRFAASAEPFADCVEQAGDVNCDGDVNEGDVLLLLLFVGGVSPAQPATGICPPIGEPLDSPTTTAPPGTATATPAANGYRMEAVISSAELGVANGSVIELAVIPGAPTEAIAVRQTGQMYRVSLSGSFAPMLWGDVSGIVDTGGTEEGLLSLAFSPGFAQDGRVYLYYTAASPNRSVLARYSTTANALDGNSDEVLLSILQFAPNHNGGHIAFDHDDYLLLSTGDGGDRGDPNENGQELNTLLGKVLRIDVSADTGYAIPGENPFVGVAGAREEIFAYGLRNPWRMTVDRFTGAVWLGDVGEGAWEEVDHVVAGGNYGWDCFEGLAVWEDDEQCEGKDFIDPRAVYSHDKGLAVVGGFVYRGSEMPELYGWYVYADYVSGRVWALNTADDSEPIELLQDNFPISSFAELPGGELLVVSYLDGIYMLVRD